MVNGLCIEEKEFLALPQKKQNLVLYQNTEELKKLVLGYKFHQKIQYVLIAAILGGLGILFRMHLISS